MKLSDQGIEWLKRHEEFRSVAYDDLNPHKVLQPGDTIQGTLTIGYGHIKDVYIGQTCSQEQATSWMKEHLIGVEQIVNNIEGSDELSQNEFDALVLWTYNIGSRHYYKKNLIRLVRAYLSFKRFLRNPEEYDRFYKTIELVWRRHYISSKKQVLQGLIERRKEEFEIFRDGYSSNTINV